ncbi:MAG: hypothetical protein OXU51_13775 [Candidatus Poribacteria bacterium]|nr:hypothetical protein [Candidatus Poribacteria bacterium]
MRYKFWIVFCLLVCCLGIAFVYKVYADHFCSATATASKEHDKIGPIIIGTQFFCEASISSDGVENIGLEWVWGNFDIGAIVNDNGETWGDDLFDISYTGGASHREWESYYVFGSGHNVSVSADAWIDRHHSEWIEGEGYVETWDGDSDNASAP